MKEFLNSFKIIIISQLICWGLFILIDENFFIGNYYNEVFALIVSIICLVIFLIMYIIFGDKIIRKNNYNSLLFNIFLYVLWVVFTVIIMFSLFKLVDIKVLHACYGTGWDCFLNGIEYLFQGILMIIFIIIVIIIRLIIALYRWVKKQS